MRYSHLTDDQIFEGIQETGAQILTARQHLKNITEGLGLPRDPDRRKELADSYKKIVKMLERDLEELRQALLDPKGQRDSPR